MTRLKLLIAGAVAALVAGVATIPLALKQSAQELQYTCAEWQRDIQRFNDVQERDTFYIAVQVGATIPNHSGDRLLGDCSGGTCTIAPPDQCDGSVTYTYDCGPAVNGWRVCSIFAPPYFAKGWKNEASTNAQFKWLGGFSTAVGKCLEVLTGQECMDAFDADRSCWLLDTGGCCRYGLRGCEPTASGLNGAACPYARVVSPMPCTVYRGAGSEMVDATRVWADEEFE
jgi:hypothetical protein